MSAPPGPLLTGPARALSPVAPQERIETLDILRGWALLGILLVNMTMDLPWIRLIPQWTSEVWINRPLYLVIDVLAEGKFFTLFSFLFGLGFSIQMSRAEKRGAAFLPTYTRRLLALYALGLLLTLLAGEGQLRIYASLGFLLLLLRRVPQKLLLTLAFACLLIGPVSDFAQAYNRRHDPALVRAQQQQRAGELADRTRRQQEGVRVHASGDFWEIVQSHAPSIWESHRSFPWFWSWSWLSGEFPLLLLGLYAGRRGIFDNLPAHLPFLRKVMGWGLGIGLPGSVMAQIIYERRQLWELAPPVWWTHQVAEVLDRVSSPALSFFYASTIVLMFTGGWGRRFLGRLAPAGRMALSNYILQWMAFMFLTYSYGLALYGKFGLAVGLLFALLIFILQVLLSRWYLKRFLFGPAEWLWRTLTYGQLQPMRLAQPAANLP